jgi:hypothetical protein
MSYAPPVLLKRESRYEDERPALGRSLSQLTACRTVSDPFHIYAPWLAEATLLARRGQMTEALDIIYDRLDSWLRTGNIQACDTILEQFSPESLPIDFSLAFLTLTRPALLHLRHRRAFYDSLAAFVEQTRGPEGAQLLAGLET